MPASRSQCVVAVRRMVAREGCGASFAETGSNGRRPPIGGAGPFNSHHQKPDMRGTLPLTVGLAVGLSLGGLTLAVRSGPQAGQKAPADAVAEAQTPREIP